MLVDRVFVHFKAIDAFIDTFTFKNIKFFGQEFIPRN